VCGRQTRKKKDSERERERGREKVRERVSEREKERKKERERERNRGGERARKRRLKQRWCSTHNLSWRPESHKDKHNASALPTFDRTSSISTGIFLATTSFAVTFLKINSAVPLSVTVCHSLSSRLVRPYSPRGDSAIHQRSKICLVSALTKVSCPCALDPLH